MVIKPCVAGEKISLFACKMLIFQWENGSNTATFEKTRLRRPKVICTSVETFGTNYCIKFIVNTAAEGGDFFLLLYMVFSEILKILLILLLYMAPYILVRHCSAPPPPPNDPAPPAWKQPTVLEKVVKWNDMNCD